MHCAPIAPGKVSFHPHVSLLCPPLPTLTALSFCHHHTAVYVYVICIYGLLLTPSPSFTQFTFFSDRYHFCLFPDFPAWRSPKESIFSYQYFTHFSSLITKTKILIFTAGNTCGQITHLSNGFTINTCFCFQENIHFNPQSRMFLRCVNEISLFTQSSIQLFPELVPGFGSICRTMPTWGIKMLQRNLNPCKLTTPRESWHLNHLNSTCKCIPLLETPWNYNNTGSQQWLNLI